MHTSIKLNEGKYVINSDQLPENMAEAQSNTYMKK